MRNKDQILLESLYNRILLKENSDEEYLRLAQDTYANKKQLQMMVYDAAKVAGYNTEGWHYSGEKFTEFNILNARRSSDIQGFFFMDTRDKYKEYGPIEYKVALRLQNPAVVGLSYDGFSPESTNDAGVKQREILIKQGYDGVIISREEGGMDYAEIVVFNPNQIKSTDPVTYDNGNIIPLSQRFDSSNNDIRY
jgi:hypothetical protein